MELTFKLNQKEDCFLIRKLVFMDEQGFENEYDDIDDDCLFITLYDGIKCIGCARVYDDEEEGVKIFGRLALLKEYRGGHLGKKTVQYTEEYLRSQNAKEIRLHAQYRLIPFYKSMGYECYGEIELDEGVEHIWMKKVL